MKYAVLETNHTPHLSFARPEQNRKIKEIIVGPKAHHSSFDDD